MGIHFLKVSFKELHFFLSFNKSISQVKLNKEPNKTKSKAFNKHDKKKI